MELYRRRRMFKREEPKYKRMLETELEHTLATLNQTSPDSQEFDKKLKSAERLHEMLNKKSSPSISRETLAIIAANLAGILLIIRNEDVNVITSKALGFVFRLK
jgi:dsDNA-binding SOS-regulon protein